MEKRRKIFDSDGTTVEEVVSVKPKKKPGLEVNTNVDSNEKKNIKVEDVIDSFAGYLPSTVNFMPKDDGECLICGQKTTSSMRKICFDCIKKYGEELYAKSKHAAKNHEDDFQI